tara:strand:+ start:1058 stop:1582 length:525 start_codon:yes stop_codon:yes gene_type:complete
MSQIKVNSIVPVAGLSGGASGGIIQVVSTFKDDTFSTSSTSYVDITGLSAAITPSSTSSKILILSSIGWGNSATAYVPFQLVKVVGGTASNIAEPSDTTLNYPGTAAVGNPNTNPQWSLQRMAYQFLDSPATTSAVTYKWQIYVIGSTTTYINRRSANTDLPTTSSITLMEVSG